MDKVLHEFTDLVGGAGSNGKGVVYSPNGPNATFPVDGVEVSGERLTALRGAKNKQGKPLIVEFTDDEIDVKAKAEAEAAEGKAKADKKTKEEKAPAPEK